MSRRGPWKSHKGYGIPRDAHGPVDVEFRDGDISSYPDGESLGGWEHEGHEHDVVLYRARPDRLVSKPRPVFGPQVAPKALADYHEDHGPVVWFAWSDGSWIGEPAWIGTPNDSDWPGYHTHYIPHPAFPRAPEVSDV